MTSTDAIAAKERICFDHEQVRDQNKCVLCGDCVRAVMKSKIGAYFAESWSNHGAWLDHESLPAYFKLTAWIAANVYAYVHGHTRTHWPQPRKST